MTIVKNHTALVVTAGLVGTTMTTVFAVTMTSSNPSPQRLKTTVNSMAKETWYRCKQCGALNGHKNSYNDDYCYGCVDIATGLLIPKATQDDTIS